MTLKRDFEELTTYFYDRIDTNLITMVLTKTLTLNITLLLHVIERKLRK